MSKRQRSDGGAAAASSSALVIPGLANQRNANREDILGGGSPGGIQKYGKLSPKSGIPGSNIHHQNKGKGSKGKGKGGKAGKPDDEDLDMTDPEVLELLEMDIEELGEIYEDEQDSLKQQEELEKRQTRKLDVGLEKRQTRKLDVGLEKRQTRKLDVGLEKRQTRKLDVGVEKRQTRKLDELRRQEKQQIGRTAQDKINALRLELRALEGEEIATIERHNRTMALIKRDERRETEAINKATATTKRDIVGAEREVSKLSQAKLTAAESMREMEEEARREAVWDDEDE